MFNDYLWNDFIKEIYQKFLFILIQTRLIHTFTQCGAQVSTATLWVSILSALLLLAAELYRSVAPKICVSCLFENGSYWHMHSH